jgi:alkaline phosphatase D
VPDLPRRRFLAGMGALAATPAAARAAASARSQDATDPFRWGVASFDPTTSSVLLWTRVDPGFPDAVLTLQWRVASDPNLEDVVARGLVEAHPDADHCVSVQVDDLPDGRVWWYGFTAPNGMSSSTGRTRTLADDAERLRIGVVSCARFADGGFAAYRALAGREVDVVVHVGDYVYEDGFDGVRPHDPPHRCRTLDDYRRRYAQHRIDADLQALHARHPMVAVWDDHDVAGNAWRDGARQHDEADDGPWLRRLRAAGQARAEWLPGRTSVGADGRLKAWRALGLGELAELVVLDTRTWGRDRQPASEEELVESDGGPYRQMLGADQQAFVAERLARDDRPRWVFLANQVMLHPLRIPAITSSMAERVADAGFLISEGYAVNPDQWDGYPRARDALLEAVGDRGGVVVLTGDVHSSWGWSGPARDGEDAAMVELVAPSVSSKTFAERISVPATLVEAGLQTIDRDLVHVELAQHGYVLVDCTSERVVGEWWQVDTATGAQELAAACSAAPEPPMRLRKEDEATQDPTPDDAASAVPIDDVDDDPPWPTIGLAAGGAVVAAGLAVALRRRRLP